jgi:hypothetical protein
MEGRMVNGRGGRVYIVVQAARRRHTRNGDAKPHAVIHGSPVYFAKQLSCWCSRYLPVPRPYMPTMGLPVPGHSEQALNQPVATL